MAFLSGSSHTNHMGEDMATFVVVYTRKGDDGQAQATATGDCQWMPVARNLIMGVGHATTVSLFGACILLESMRRADADVNDLTAEWRRSG
jgi:hypothetical protein